MLQRQTEANRLRYILLTYYLDTVCFIIHMYNNEEIFFHARIHEITQSRNLFLSLCCDSVKDQKLSYGGVRECDINVFRGSGTMDW